MQIEHIKDGVKLRKSYSPEKATKQHSFYKRLFDVCNFSIIVTCRNSGVIIDANDHATELFNRNLVGFHISDLHPLSILSGFDIDDNDFMVKELEISTGNTEFAIFVLFSATYTRDLDTSKFLAIMAHELRNPMSIIKTAVYNINRKNSNESIKGNLSRIDRKILECDEIINDCLSLAKKEVKRLKKVPILNAIRECITHYSKEHTHCNIALQLDNKTDDNDILVFCNPTHLNQILHNIIKNACQAVPKKSGTINIHLQTFPDNNICKVSVVNNGKVISPENLKKVLLPFFSTKQGGTGLGLAITKQLMATNGGKIEIDSNKTRGTTVSLFFTMA